MADQKKVVQWSSEIGRLAQGQTVQNGKLEPARSVLAKAHAFMTPFVKKLSTNTGDARIAITVEYIERNRARGPVESFDKQTSAIEKLLSPLKALNLDPFHPTPFDTVKHSTDLPCPKCQAGSGMMCSADATLLVTGNGWTTDDQIKIHDERARVFAVYTKLL